MDAGPDDTCHQLGVTSKFVKSKICDIDLHGVEADLQEHAQQDVFAISHSRLTCRATKDDTSSLAQIASDPSIVRW